MPTCSNCGTNREYDDECAVCGGTDFGDYDPAYPCPHCDETFGTHRARESHAADCDGSPTVEDFAEDGDEGGEEEEEEEEEFECEECGDTFDTRRGLNSHSRVHADE